eukprot:5039509-Amphidinium_carterae.1
MNALTQALISSSASCAKLCTCESDPDYAQTTYVEDNLSQLRLSHTKACSNLGAQKTGTSTIATYFPKGDATLNGAQNIDQKCERMTSLKSQSNGP